MPSDPSDLIPLADAAAWLPRRRGKKVHYSTLYRWATKGTRGRVLKTQLVGGVRYTSREALRVFFDGATGTPEAKRQSDELRRVLYGEQAATDDSADLGRDLRR